MATRKLVVSVHDVTPKYKSELSEIVVELDRIGIASRSILAVPNWENAHDLRKDDNFIAWLHELREGGDEILMHGYTHASEKRAGYYKNPFQWFMGEIFAQGCGEFQNISYQEARQEIQDGKKIFSDIQLDDSVGFVAPAWLVNSDVERALEHEGFRYHIFTSFWHYVCRLSTIPIKNLETGEVISSKEIAFDGSRAVIDYGTRSLAWLLTRNKRSDSIRIAIHPQDIHDARPFDYALQLIQEAKEGRELTTYAGLLALS